MRNPLGEPDKGQGQGREQFIWGRGDASPRSQSQESWGRVTQRNLGYSPEPRTGSQPQRTNPGASDLGEEAWAKAL